MNSLYIDYLPPRLEGTCALPLSSQFFQLPLLTIAASGADYTASTAFWLNGPLRMGHWDAAALKPLMNSVDSSVTPQAVTNTCQGQSWQLRNKESSVIIAQDPWKSFQTNFPALGQKAFFASLCSQYQREHLTCTKSLGRGQAEQWPPSTSQS